MSRDALKRKLSPAAVFTAVYTAVTTAVIGPPGPASRGHTDGTILRRLVTFSLAFALLLSTAAPLAPQAAAHNRDGAGSPDGNSGQPADQSWQDQSDQNGNVPADTSSDQQTNQPAGSDAPQPSKQPSNAPSSQQAGGHFATLPPGSKLPTGEECASRVRRSSWEPRAENYKANHTTGKSGVQIDGANAQGQSQLAPRIDGNFTGTTDEIIQWGACKWGFDEDIVRAVAVNESTWRQSEVGDGGHSYGLLQIKDSVHDGTFPLSKDSTPFNVDYSLAWRRACFEGDFDWAKMGAQNDEWSCVGLWFSGDPNGGADNYVGNAKQHLQEKPWLGWEDQSSQLPADANQSSPAPDANSNIPVTAPDTASQEPTNDSTETSPSPSDTPADTSASPSDTPTDTNADAGDKSADTNADTGDKAADTHPDASEAPADTNTNADAPADSDEHTIHVWDGKKHRKFSISAYIRFIFELCDPRSWFDDGHPGGPDKPSTDEPSKDEPGSEGSKLVIYDNGVAPDFDDATSGVQRSEPCDKSIYVSAPCSYGAALQASGAYNFKVKAADGLKTDPYIALEFNLNTSNQPIENFSAAFSDMNDKAIKDVVLSKDNVVKTLENGWVHVVVPLSDLNASNAPVLRIQIKNATQNQLDTIHLDDVELSGSSKDAASPAPDEGTTPDESAAPSDANTPSESPAPSDATMPSESTAPAESNAPSESTAPAESNAPAETPAPSEGNGPAESPVPSESPATTPVTETGSDISGLHVQGNQLLNGAGQAVKLRGVNHSGTEYACIQGNGIFEGPNDDASVKAIKNWNANVVRVPMNEGCWLAINGAPDQYSGEKYQQAIKDYVDLLTKNGIATILELHWTAPGGEKATGQKPMLNKDHSVEFWKQVAGAFKDNHSVIFDPHNEPFPDGNKDTDAAWTCWRDGGNCSGSDFQAAGMQEIVDTIRGAGAKNVVMLGGVRYSNGLSQWLKYKPNDPENNLMASWHVYPFNLCKDTACYDKELKPVMAQVPLMAGEIGQDDCGSDFIKEVMTWLDQNGGHYAAWVWNTWGTDCGSISLISNYDGTPNGDYGQGFKDHLASQ